MRATLVIVLLTSVASLAFAEGREWKQASRKKVSGKTEMTPASRLTPTTRVRSKWLRHKSSIQIEPISSKRLHKVIKEDPSEVLLVNLWATWCKPCREEFPDLLKISAKYRDRGLKVIHVSTDDPSRSAQVRRYLKGFNITGKTYLRREPDEQFINGVHRSWSGSLPAVLLFRKGKLVKFWEGKARYSWFDSTLKSIF